MLADKLEAVEAKMESNMEIAWAHNFESGNISPGCLLSENKTKRARMSRCQVSATVVVRKHRATFAQSLLSTQTNRNSGSVPQHVSAGDPEEDAGDAGGPEEDAGDANRKHSFVEECAVTR